MTDVIAPVDQGPALPPPGGGTAATPIREVLALPDFRRYWVAQFLAALGNGALRFVFVWLALDLSERSSAPGLLGTALGVPALLLMVPAGAWSDRTDRKRLIVVAQVAVGAVLGVAAAVTWAGAMTLPLAAVFAVVAGALLAVGAPALQALVPSLVPAHRVMTGAALQGMGLNASLLFGALVGGAAIAVGGAGLAFAVLGTLQVLAAVAMSRVDLPDRIAGPARPLFGDIGQGIRFAAGHEPVRSLLGVCLIAGFSWGIVTVLLPEVAEDVLGVGAFASSSLFAALGIGLLVTSMVVASRDLRRPGVLLAVSASTLLGGGVVLMGLSTSYWLTMAVMVAWGVGGGTCMTLQRGLLQRHTPPEVMGRVMGLNALAMIGSFPLASGAASILASALGPADALVVVGLAGIVASVLVGWRRAIRTA